MKYNFISVRLSIWQDSYHMIELFLKSLWRFEGFFFWFESKNLHTSITLIITDALTYVCIEQTKFGLSFILMPGEMRYEQLLYEKKYSLKTIDCVGWRCDAHGYITSTEYSNFMHDYFISRLDNLLSQRQTTIDEWEKKRKKKKNNKEAIVSEDEFSSASYGEMEEEIFK